MKCEGALEGGKDRPIQRVLKAHTSNETATTAMSHISECGNEDECQSIATAVACDMEAHTTQGSDDLEEDDADKYHVCLFHLYEIPTDEIHHCHQKMSANEKGSA